MLVCRTASRLVLLLPAAVFVCIGVLVFVFGGFCEILYVVAVGDGASRLKVFLMLMETYGYRRNRHINGPL